MRRRLPPSVTLFSSVVALPLLAGMAAFIVVAVGGPITLSTITPVWAAALAGLLPAELLWWAGYLWLLRRLSKRAPRGAGYVLWPLALLSLSLLPDLAVFLSGKLPYSMPFDQGAYILYRYLAGAILMATLITQELILLMAARDLSLTELVTEAALRGGMAARKIVGIPRSVVASFPTSLPLLAILAIGAKLRLDTLNSYHYGDMDVMLSITYNLLGWPPVTYYHNYMPQTWVYNHLPLFPIMLAPFYWLSEHLFHISTAWTAKILIGVADGVIALTLYRQAGVGWRRAWGLLLAAAWMLSPLVVHGDDHPVAVAIAFALLALATVQRPWLSGLLLALGVATRSEIAFLALPIVIHFVARRPLSQSVAFLATSGTTIALIALPFVLFDPSAMDYAMRRQLQRDAATSVSTLASTLLPYLSQNVAAFLRVNSGLLAFPVNGLLALFAIRDQRVARVVFLVAVAYLFTLPILLDRYTLFAFAVGLLYAAQYTNPIIAGAVFLAAWPGFPYGGPVLIALLATTAVLALLDHGGDALPEVVPSR